MATSTFTKQFSVEQKKVDEFVEEMSKAATPTLQPNFQTRLAHLPQDIELKAKVQKALSK